MLGTHAGPGRHRNERGIALLAVVAVLVLLTIIATPFLITMRDGADRGAAQLASAQAEREAENVFRLATLYLEGTTEGVERMAAEGGLKTQPHTHLYDTEDELQVPSSFLEAASVDGDRLWGVDVQDEQGKINVNSAPFQVLGGFFGMTQLAAPLAQDDTEVELTGPGGLPAEGGVVRIGDEVIRYDRMEGNLLRGIRRGYEGDRPGNGPPRSHGSRALVVNEIAFQIAAYPILARRNSEKTEYAPYTNLYELRRIGDLGTVALNTSKWESVVDHLTVNSQRVASGHVWGDPQTLQQPVKAGEDGHKAVLTVENPMRFGMGTLVRVTDGANTDYAVVFGIQGGRNVHVVPALQHDFDADVTQVQTLTRHPVNVNTASREVLIALHTGVARHGQAPLSRDTAELVADRILKNRAERPFAWTSAGGTGLRSMRDYARMLDDLVSDRVLEDNEAAGLGMNALNPKETAGTRLAIGTVPVTFRSGDVYTITARAVVLDNSGRELGRREFRRLVSVNPGTSTVVRMDTQDELDEVLRATDSKWMTTFPNNVAPYDGSNNPPSRYIPFFRNELFPNRDPNEHSGSVRLAHSRLTYYTFPQPEHYDNTDFADGHYMEKGHESFNTSSGNVGLSTDDGVPAFSVSLWFKPYWGGRRAAYIFDSGYETYEDRIVLFYDSTEQELVFRVADTGTERSASEVRYDFSDSTWDDDRWYHIHASATGSKPGQMNLVIDGHSRGKPTMLTYLTSGVDENDRTLSRISVEDASSFPESGALILRGPDGTEIMEYDSRTDNSFAITRRFARLNLADTDENYLKQLQDEGLISADEEVVGRGHDSGESVMLYGYSMPLGSNIPAGNGTLPERLGRWNVLMLTAPNPPSTWPEGAGGSGGDVGGVAPIVTNASVAAAPVLGHSFGAGVLPFIQDGEPGGGSGGGGGFAIYGWRDSTMVLNVANDLTGWNSDAGTVAVEALGTSGYALLATSDGDSYSVDVDPNPILGAELVSYKVEGGNVTLTRGVEPPAGWTWGQADYSGGRVLPFVPRHSYGDSSSPIQQPVYVGDDFPADKLGFISILVPLTIEVSGAAAEDFLDPDADVSHLPEQIFAQISTGPDTEWIKYDDPIYEPAVSENLLLLRNKSAQASVAIFDTQFAMPGEDDPGDVPGDPGDGDPGDGDEPPAPPDDPGDGEDGPGGDPDAPPPPDDPGPGDEDGPGGDPDIPPVPDDPGPGDEDGPGTDPDAPPVPDDPGPGDEDGPGGDPDIPTPPEDPGPGDEDGPGGDPDTPPDPGDGPDTDPDPDPDPDPGPDPGDGGGEVPDPDDGSGTPSDTVTDETPFGVDKIATPLDFRATKSDMTQTSGLLMADTTAKIHQSGEPVLPCFLVAFPGMEYDPQGNDKDLAAPVPPTSGGGTSGGPAGQTGNQQTSAPTVTPGGSASSAIDPGDARVDGRFIEPGPGRNDTVTLVIPGEASEEHVVNHSYRLWASNQSPNNPTIRSWTFIALREAVEETVEWSSGILGGDENLQYGYSKFAYGIDSGGLGDVRRMVRLVKTPSGELPARSAEQINVGAAFDDTAFAQAVIDEVRFATRQNVRNMVNPRTFFAGERPEFGTQGRIIGSSDLDIPLHPYQGYTSDDAEAIGLNTNGGIVRIGEEMIGYARWDAGSQTLVGCDRGAFGTEARDHSYAAPITPVNGIGVSRLEEGLSETDNEISLASVDGFPQWDAYVRIGDEILGYTRVDGTVLKMPATRNKRESSFSFDQGTVSGSGLYRGRFGSQSAAHEVESLVYHFDHRYHDRSHETADDPTMAYFLVSKEIPGAIWKRISWNDRTRPLNRIRALVRFEGGPAWDSDKIIRLETDGIPEVDRRKWLYEVTDPNKINLLNVQSDRIECRVFFVFEAGAYDMLAAPAADAWKETPWLQSFRIEYLAPTGVLTTEDLR